MTFPLIHQVGTTYEQGLIHGEALAEGIRTNIALYHDRFQNEVKLTLDELYRRVRLYRDAIAEQTISYMAGMKGIADGAQLPLDDIVMLNVRYEILYYQFAANDKPDGCTSFVVDRSRSADGKTYMAQNWDWFPGVSCALVKTTDPNGFESLTFTEAGIFGGKIGINAAGIGLCINGLSSFNDDWTTLYTPFHMRCWQILRQQRLVDALGVVRNTPRACSGNFVIGQAGQTVVNIEAAPTTALASVCENGTMVHTNHFVDPTQLGILVSESDRINSDHRYQRTEARLRERTQYDLSQLMDILRDHDNYPNSVCQHVDEDLPAHDWYVTIASMILDLEARTMYVAAGNPCRTPYTTYQIEMAHNRIH